MEIDIEGVSVSKHNNGLLIKNEKAFYMLANRDYFDFQYITQFDNHYYNEKGLKRVLVQKHGISVITSVEFFEEKFFTNISLLLDAKLDNITLLNLYKVAVETISTVSWQVEAINEDELSNKLGNYYNMVYVACQGKSEKIISFDISLYYEVKELLTEALNKSFSYLGYTQKNSRGE